MGMLRCQIEGGEEPATARFVGGLNREIQDIVEYKDYNSITKCFHIACKAEREVQGQRAARSNVSAGKSAPWQQRTPPPTPSPSHSAPPPSSSDKTQVVPTNSATKSAPKPAGSTSSVASTGRTRDVQCHRCKGFGHVQRDCPNKRVLVVKNDGGYSSASDYDEQTLALLAADDAGSVEPPDEQIGIEDAEHYESLIVQCVLSAQMEKAEQNQRHTLFQTKCVIKEHSCRLIIDGGSCNNLASSDMVEKLSLTTKLHPHPYHI